MDHINQSNSDILNTLTSMKLVSPSREKEAQFLTQFQSKLLRIKSPEVTAKSFTRTVQHRNIQPSPACMITSLSTLKPFPASSWMDPNKSQKHIRSIVTRIAIFSLSLAKAEEVENLESECLLPGSFSGNDGIENDANASESWKLVSRLKSLSE